MCYVSDMATKFKIGDKVVSTRKLACGVTHGIVDAVDVCGRSGVKVGIKWYANDEYAYATYEGSYTQFMRTVEVVK